MLEFENQKSIIVKELYASQIKEKLLRFRKGDFTKNEIEYFKKEKEISKKYKSIWVD